MHKITTGTLFIGLIALGLGGCDKVTGGGRIIAQNGDRATIGFSADSCDFLETGEVDGHFTLVDNKAEFGPDDEPVRLRAEVTAAVLNGCAGDGTLVTADYISTNPDLPGDGTLEVCVEDDGQGNAAADEVSVEVLSGPYDGYEISGELQGNVKSHGCPE